MMTSIINNRQLILELALNDLKARFSSSLLGVAWTFLQPLVNMLIIWLVFQVGFKSSNLSDDTPFIVWYMPAFLVWNFFSDATSQATGSIIEYSYLVKKVNFNVEIIPVIKIVSSGVVHLLFYSLIILINLVYGRYPTLFYLQGLYYFFCASLLSLSIGMLCSSVAPYVADISNIIAILLQTGFWVTPIFWDASSMTDFAKLLLSLNPMYYICTGYRDSFVYGLSVGTHWRLTIYFWALTLIILFLAIRVFNKAKIHFDDVL